VDEKEFVGFNGYSKKYQKQIWHFANEILKHFKQKMEHAVESFKGKNEILKELCDDLKGRFEEYKENKKYDPNCAEFKSVERMLAEKEEYFKQKEINQKLQENLQNKTKELTDLYGENKELRIKFMEAEKAAKTSKVLTETRHENERLATQNQGLTDRISEYKEEISILKKTIHNFEVKVEDMITSHQLQIKTLRAEGESRILEKTNLIQKEMQEEFLKFKESIHYANMEKEKMIYRNKDLVSENTKLNAKLDILNEQIMKLEADNQQLFSELNYEQENAERWQRSNIENTTKADMKSKAWKQIENKLKEVQRKYDKNKIEKDQLQQEKLQIIQSYRIQENEYNTKLHEINLENERLRFKLSNLKDQINTNPLGIMTQLPAKEDNHSDFTYKENK
jgi:myosin heavy subunit